VLAGLDAFRGQNARKSAAKAANQRNDEMTTATEEMVTITAAEYRRLKALADRSSHEERIAQQLEEGRRLNDEAIALARHNLEAGPRQFRVSLVSTTTKILHNRTKGQVLRPPVLVGADSPSGAREKFRHAFAAGSDDYLEEVGQEIVCEEVPSVA